MPSATLESLVQIQPNDIKLMREIVMNDNKQFEIIQKLLERDPQRVLDLYNNGKLKTSERVIRHIEVHFGLEPMVIDPEELKFKVLHPQYGEVQILALYEKGKKHKDHRFLIRDEEGTCFFLWDERYTVVNGTSSEKFGKLERSSTITESDVNNYHIKIGVYNYYKTDSTTDEIRKAFVECVERIRACDPLLPTGKLGHFERQSVCKKEFVLDKDGNMVK